MSRNASAVRTPVTANNEIPSPSDNMENDSTNPGEPEPSKNLSESRLSNHHHKRRKKKDKNKLVPEINIWEDDDISQKDKNKLVPEINFWEDEVSKSNDNKEFEDGRQKDANFHEMKYLTGGSDLSMEMHPYSGDLEQKVNHFLASNWDKESMHDSKSDISIPKTFNVSFTDSSARRTQFKQYIDKDDPLAQFVYDKNIGQRECSHYVRDNDAMVNDSCKCGRSLQWHKIMKMNVNCRAIKKIWHPKTHTKMTPCDSFGEIEFRGFGHGATISPFIRLDYMTSLEHVWTILTEHWQIPEPKLLISVTGGAGNMNLKPKLGTIFKRGLINAATSTGAWILTGGTSVGVMSLVGDAIKEHKLMSNGSNVVAIGTATWGAVANNIALNGNGMPDGLHPAQYNINDLQEGPGTAALEHNHTHFLLLDDGTTNQHGAELRCRAQLVSFISKRARKKVAVKQKMTVPVVLLILEGGYATITYARTSVENGSPIVVIEGSGRAADYISHGYKLTKMKNKDDQSFYPDHFNTIMMNKAKKMFSLVGQDCERIAGQCVQDLRVCLDERKLVNVFNVDEADRELDKAILFSQLKANKADVHSQVALAMAWNRCDIARQQIFTYSNRTQWQKLNLQESMFIALTQNKSDFVELFLDIGVDLRQFLSVSVLWNLYEKILKDIPNSSAEHVKNLLLRKQESWKNLCEKTSVKWTSTPRTLDVVGRLLQQLLGDSFHNYTGPKFIVDKTRQRLNWTDVADLQDMAPEQRKWHTPCRAFDHPERDLFLWAVLFNRREMAEVFWRCGKDQIGAALTASSLLSSLGTIALQQEQITLNQHLVANALYYESLGVNILSECYNKDKQLAHQLLVRELHLWGDSTLFQRADSGQLMDFMEHPCCQTKLNSVWKGKMPLYTPTWQIILTILCPLAILFMTFTTNESISEDYDMDNDIIDDDYEDEEIIDKMHAAGRNQVMPTDGDTGPPTTGYSVFRGPKVNVLEAIYYFYTSPVTTFYTNCIAYIIFLALFSYFVLIDLRPWNEVYSPSAYEYVTWVWMLSMVIEEFRQVVTGDHNSLQYRVAYWVSSMWNRFDAALFVLFIIAMILRYNLDGDDFVWARGCYTVTLTMSYLRFMQMFFVEMNTGPKIIMIQRMLTDLLFFIFLLAVFVLSFGVSYQSMLYPNSPASWDVLKGVLYKPYFQIYGELFLDTIEGKDDGSCTHNETLWRMGGMERCPQQTWLIPLLLVVYMVLTNILLVNLLIAMFSYTFQKVQDNSEKLWRFYRFSLIYEYYDRPALVPPLIIFNIIFRMFWAIFYYICHQQKTRNTIFKKILTPEQNNRLTVFEKSATENYLTAITKSDKDTSQGRTRKMIDTVLCQLENIKEQVQINNNSVQQTVNNLSIVSDPSDVSSHLVQKVNALEEQMDQLSVDMSTRMDKIMEMLQKGEKSRSSRKRSPKKHTSPVRDDADDSPWETGDE